jgi:hypothetical protein
MNDRPYDPSLAALEQSLLHASDVLRCLAAVAYETGDSLSGPKRDLAFSMTHLVDVLKADLDSSLAYFEPKAGHQSMN